MNERLQGVKPGDPLLLTPQIQNQYDEHAVMLHTVENHFAGWIPTYFAAELQPLLLQQPKKMRCAVEKINLPLDTWVPDILLVKVTGLWPPDWNPFTTGDFKPITALTAGSTVKR